MEYTYGSPGCVTGQGDLIDFSSDTSLENVNNTAEENVENNTEIPILKSKERGQINSDVVAIKSGSGDIAFVAVGRPSSINPKITKKSHRKTRSTSEKRIYQSDSFPRPQERVITGIDNPGYMTVSRNESYSYDETGFTYSSPPERFRSADHSPVQHNDHSGDDYTLVWPMTSNAREAVQDLRVNVSNLQTTLPTQTSQNERGGNSVQHSQQVLDNASEVCTTAQTRSEEHLLSSQTPQDAFSDLSEHARSGTTTPDSECEPSKKSTPKNTTPVPKQPPMCKLCGQNHGVTENHEYNYVEEVDEDLMCDICLQPLVEPFDTKCGHTFCSICIKNYLRVKHICPVDREELTSEDCWQSSLILRKLLNKLMVTCPHESHCDKQIQRCDLKDHLKDKCPGAIIRCTKSMYGCAYKTARSEMEKHMDECPFKDFNDKLSDLHPLSEDIVVELFRPEGTAELGIMIVGGSDTPLHYIIIQDIMSKSLAAQDGRLHVGDIIVSINDEPLFSVTHAEARAALTKPSNLMRFSLLRDIETNEDNGKSLTRKSSSSNFNEEYVCLLKPPLEQLGIRIASSETGGKGVYIIELIEGQVAESDGRLQVGDRIMKIENNDLTDSTPEQAARVISNCDKEVKILVRHALPKPTVVCNEWAQYTTLPRSKNVDQSSKTSSKLFGPQLSSKSILECSQKKKVISVKKGLKENLGIIVSGGNGSPRGNLPIFVQDVLPMSVLGKDNRIKRGDLLSEINYIKLTGLSHTQAMNVLRECAQQRAVTLVAFELDYAGKAEDTALWDELTSLHQNPSKWAPSWKMWLAATQEFSPIQEVTLRKPATSSSFGFKIIGGFSEEQELATPIFVSHITQNTSASKYLKCGDEIVAINKRPIKDISYQQVLNVMKTSNTVSLKIVSWPGSLH